MDSVLNPYTPNAGASPDIVVGRDEQTQAFTTLLRRLARGRTHQSMIITGLRGVGKTVLLNEFGDIARGEHWEVLEIEASKQMMTPVSASRWPRCSRPRFCVSRPA